jgi:hypothetical protein
MQGAYGGLVVIMIYGTYETIPTTGIDILTESGNPILTEAAENITTES